MEPGGAVAVDHGLTPPFIALLGEGGSSPIPNGFNTDSMRDIEKSIAQARCEDLLRRNFTSSLVLIVLPGLLQEYFSKPVNSGMHAHVFNALFSFARNLFILNGARPLPVRAPLSHNSFSPTQTSLPTAASPAWKAVARAASLYPTFS